MVFSTIQCAQSKRILYLTLVRPHLLYCSSLWHPHLPSNIRSLETMQIRATKFIICESSLDYKEHLMNSNLLPLMMEYDIRNILIFFLKCVKTNNAHFNIHDFLTFRSTKTRSSTFFKLRHSKSSNNIQSNEFFNSRLWNSLPLIDIRLSIKTLKAKLRKFFWQYLYNYNFDSNNYCSFHFLCPCHKCSQFPVTLRFSKFVL